MAFEALRAEPHWRNLIGQVWLTYMNLDQLATAKGWDTILELFPLCG